ncbi:MAG: D-alanine--D-alanine ligase [Christensenellales bacterium]
MKNYVITFGGDSCEHDVSVITALSAYNAINQQFNILPIYLKNAKFYLCKNPLKIEKIINFSKKDFSEVCFSGGELRFVGKRKKGVRVDCAINCNHGGGGENGALAGVFELAAIPYTSAGVFPSALYMDKVFGKHFLEKKKFPVVPYKVCRSVSDLSAAETLGFPVIVKPARQGSSIGIGIAKDAEELAKAFDFAKRFDDKVLVEKALEGFTELNCAAYLRGGEIIISDIEKIETKGDFYDFDSKYGAGGASRQIPAVIEDKLTDRIKRITAEIYRYSELRGVVRIDFLLSSTGKLYVNEINTVPGSLAFYLFKGQGINLSELICDLAEEGIAEYERKKEKITCFKDGILSDFNASKLEIGVKK